MAKEYLRPTEFDAAPQTNFSLHSHSFDNLQTTPPDQVTFSGHNGNIVTLTPDYDVFTWATGSFTSSYSELTLNVHYDSTISAGGSDTFTIKYSISGTLGPYTDMVVQNNTNSGIKLTTSASLPINVDYSLIEVDFDTVRGNPPESTNFAVWDVWTEGQYPADLPVTGTSHGSSTAKGILTRKKVISGTSKGKSSARSRLSRTVAIAAVVIAASTCAATLGITSPIPVAPSTGQAQVSANLGIIQRIFGTSQAGGSFVHADRLDLELSSIRGSTCGRSRSTANAPILQVRPSVTSIGQSQASARAHLSLLIKGHSQGQAHTVALIQAPVSLEGDSVGQAQTSAALLVTRFLRGSAGSNAQTDAFLEKTITLKDANTNGIAQSSALLTRTAVSTKGTVYAQASAHSALLRIVRPVAHSHGQSLTHARAQITANITGASHGSGNVSAKLGIRRDLIGVVNGVTQVVGVVVKPAEIFIGTINGQALSSAKLTVNSAPAGTSVGSALMNARLGKIIPLLPDDILSVLNVTDNGLVNSGSTILSGPFIGTLDFFTPPDHANEVIFHAEWDGVSGGPSTFYNIFLHGAWTGTDLDSGYVMEVRPIDATPIRINRNRFDVETFTNVFSTPTSLSAPFSIRLIGGGVPEVSYSVKGIYNLDPNTTRSFTDTTGDDNLGTNNPGISGINNGASITATWMYCGKDITIANVPVSASAYYSASNGTGSLTSEVNGTITLNVDFAEFPVQEISASFGNFTDQSLYGGAILTASLVPDVRAEIQGQAAVASTMANTIAVGGQSFGQSVAVAKLPANDPLSGSIHAQSTVKALLNVGVSGPDLDPPALAKMWSWHRADEGITTGSGADVTQWDDKTIHGRHLTQSLSTQFPQWVSSTSSFNDQPVVSFDGANDFLNLIDASNPLTGSDMTFAIIASKATEVGDQVLGNFAIQDVGSNDFDNIKGFDWNTGRDPNRGTTDEIEYDGTRLEFTEPGVGSAFHIVGQFQNGTIKIYKNGVTLLGEVSATMGFVGSKVTISARDPLGNSSWARFAQNDYLEIIVYQGSLTSGETDDLFTYLDNSLSGTLGGPGGALDVVGTAHGQSRASAIISTATQGRATTHGQSSVTADLLIRRNVSASTFGRSSVAARILLDHQPSATSIGQSQVSGKLSLNRSIKASEVQGRSAVSGFVTAGVDILVGSSSGQSRVSARLQRTRSIAASANGQSSVSANALITRNISGTSMGRAQIVGNATLSVTATGASYGSARSSARIGLAPQVTGTTHGQSVATGFISDPGATQITATSVGRSKVSGDFTVDKQLNDAKAIGRSQVSALLDAIALNNGTSFGQARASALLTRSVRTTANAHGRSTASARLTIGLLRGSTHGQSQTIAFISEDAPITSTSVGQSQASATLISRIALNANATAQGVVRAVLTEDVSPLSVEGLQARPVFIDDPLVDCISIDDPMSRFIEIDDPLTDRVDI